MDCDQTDAQKQNNTIYIYIYIYISRGLRPTPPPRLGLPLYWRPRRYKNRTFCPFLYPSAKRVSLHCMYGEIEKHQEKHQTWHLCWSWWVLLWFFLVSLAQFWSSGGLQESPWASLGPPVEKSIAFSVNSPPPGLPIGASCWYIVAPFCVCLPSFVRDRFWVDSGINLGSILGVVWMIVGVILGCFFYMWRSTSQNEQVCFDFAGVGGLHVRPSARTSAFMWFS